MNKKTFLSKEKVLIDKINSLKDELCKLRDKYVQEHKICDVGDLVKVSGGHWEEKRFVSSVSYIGNGLIKYGFVKCKKDLTPSKVKDGYATPGGHVFNYKIELIQKRS